MEISNKNPEINNLKNHIMKVNNQKKEVEETTEILYRIKKEVIKKLEETKRSIRTCMPIIQPGNSEMKSSILVRDKTVSLLDRDISHIQNLHDVVIQDLKDLKKNLDNHSGIVEKTDLIMNLLNYKLYEIQYNFRTLFDKLQKTKEGLLKTTVDGRDDSKVALQIVEIEDEIVNLEQNHQKEMECVKEQKIDAQKAYERACQIMDHHFDEMIRGFNKLQVLIEAEKATFGTSQSQFTDSKFASEIKKFKDDIDKFTELQTTGWKIMYPEEKISDILQERGLHVLNTGQLVTEDGRIISYKEAKETKLLDNISLNILEELKKQLKVEDDVRSASNKSSDVSPVKVISSEDIHYLKTCLGKPLALAIAEITAVHPRDPIHYLGHWLFKYRYNQQMDDINSVEFETLNEQRERLAKERWHRIVEDEAKAAVMDMIIQAEEIGMMNEMLRLQREAEEVEEMENYDEEARDTLGPYNGPQTGQMPL